MKIKNIFLLASCLIVIVPTANFSYSQQPEESQSLSQGQKQLQAIAASTFIGVATMYGMNIFLGKHVWIDAFGKAILLDPGQLSGAMSGAAGMLAGRSAYYFLYERDSKKEDGSINIQIKKQ